MEYTLMSIARNYGMVIWYCGNILLD